MGIYTKDFSEDSLLLLRSLTNEMNEANTSIDRKKTIDNILTAKYINYKMSVKENHPFLVYIKTPIMLSLNLFIQSGVHNLFFFPFSYLSIVEKTIKLFF